MPKIIEFKYCSLKTDKSFDFKESPLSLRKNFPFTIRVHCGDIANLETIRQSSRLNESILKVAPPPPYTGYMEPPSFFLTTLVPNSISQISFSFFHSHLLITFSGCLDSFDFVYPGLVPGLRVTLCLTLWILSLRSRMTKFSYRQFGENFPILFV